MRGVVWTAGLWCLFATGGLARAQAPQVPRAETRLEVEFRAGAQIEVAQLLAMWARHFKARVVQSPLVDQARVRFLTPVDGPLTWGAVKSILAFHQVLITEEQPTPGGPWVIKAIHEREAQTHLRPFGPPVRPGELPETDALVTAVVQLEHGAGRAILPVLQVLMSRSAVRGQVLYVPGPELLILFDLADRIRHYLELIRSLDVPGPGRAVTLRQLQAAAVDEVVGLLEQVLASLPRPPQAVLGPGTPPDQGPRVFAYPRTNLLVVVASPTELEQIDALLTRVDVQTARRSTHVYGCRHADPVYLAGRLAELLGGSGGGAPSEGDQPGAVVVARPDASPHELETRIVPDQRNSSLLIQAEPPALEEILALLGELDRVPRRVLLEIEVWEIATPTDQITVAVELASLDPAKDGSNRVAALTQFGLSSLNVATDGDGNPTGLSRVPAIPGGGLSAALTHGAFDQLPVLVTAVQTFEESSLVTRSMTFTNDNIEANFSVSNSVPFVQQVVNNGVSVPSVSYADAATELRVVPHINSAGNLTLEIGLTVSSFAGSGSPELPPATNQRTYDGTITVPNNRYVVFGGLELETERTAESKVPFLGDIPLLGHLFKRWTHSKSQSRLYVFVRPTILDEDDFDPEVRLGQRLRERAHVQAKRDDWLPPLVPDRLLRGAGWSLQDEAFEQFGLGSYDPF